MLTYRIHDKSIIAGIIQKINKILVPIQSKLISLFINIINFI